MTARRRSWWGWGWEGEGPDARQKEAIAAGLRSRFERADLVPTEAVPLSEIQLPEPRLAPPDSLADICSASTYERASHTYGKSYRDVVRGFAGRFDHPPDLVCYPRSPAEVAAALDWAGDSGAAVVPYGAGSSVVGGVECDGAGYAGVVTIDLSKMNRIEEIDPISRAARVQAGIRGPELEDGLRPLGLTLRHFPQSFEFSTLGGWLATRSGGHYATARTHIDDFVESISAVTPAGPYESRRLPGSGAGPSPDRVWLGSEGILGVITQAWMRLQDRPRWKASAAVQYPDYDRAVGAVRAVVQSGLEPTNCRLLDRTEAALSAGGDGRSHLLVLGFESADHPVEWPMARALEICRDVGGEPSVPRFSDSATDASGAAAAGAVETWRNAFVRAPYSRDALVSMGVVVETFETACTWDRFEDLHRQVTDAVNRALAAICGGGWVTCRFTHVYPDGPAPYFSVLAPGRRGSELAQWADIKAAASEALLAAGGTITHHHAVGRDHRPWYDRQRPDLFASSLRAVKTVMDPQGLLNPGVLIDR